MNPDVPTIAKVLFVGAVCLVALGLLLCGVMYAK